MIRRSLLVILLVLVVSPAWALTPYYVDPNWGGTQSGSAAQPWTAPNWSTINTTLATDDVVVYFAARLSTSDTNVTSTSPISVNRTDTSSHRLTLDGISQYNTSEVSPSWTAYVTPTASDPKWNSSHFQITGTTPISTETTAFPSVCNHDITIQGFRLIRTEGQNVNLGYTGNLTFQYNVLSSGAAGTYGPGIFAGPANSGTGCAGGHGPDNVSILNNWNQSSFGECIYIGGGTADPPAPGVNQTTGDNYLIQGNKLQGCAASGGQGDGIDVKDGHTNLRIIGNWISTRSNGGALDLDSQGIEVESASVIDGNYIEQPGKHGIVLWSSYNNGIGRTVRVSNNIIVNVVGTGNQYGIQQDVLAASLSVWTATIVNNTIHITAPTFSCIDVGAGHNAAIVENNIVSQCGGPGVTASGPVTTNDYNLWYNSGSPSGSHSRSGNPLFVNANSPYVDTNFKLQPGSAAVSAGLNLAGIFTNDYAGTTRGVVPWDLGAFSTSTPTTLPPAPASLAVH